jgi:ATP-dependent Clp protease ATP-binding subunit ClpC
VYWHGSCDVEKCHLTVIRYIERAYMEKNFSVQVHGILKNSREEALRLRNDFISTEHLLLGLLRDKSIHQLLLTMNCNVFALKSKLEKYIHPLPYAVVLEDVPLTKRAENVLKVAWMEANRAKVNEISINHLFLALLQEKESVACQVLITFNITYERVKNELESLGDASTTTEEKNDPESASLSQFGEELIELAKKKLLDPVIGRDKEIIRIIRILCRKKKNNPILIGEPGVGKTAVVEGLANWIVENKAPMELANVKIFRLDLASLISGTSMRGQLEKRLQQIFKALAIEKNTILFIDEIHNIIGTGGNNSPLDISNMLKPLLANGNIKCIGTTTLNDYRHHFEKDRALERRFQKVMIEPPSEEDAMKILKGIKRKYEVHHHVRYTDAALSAAIRLSERYLKDRFLPDKAIDLIDEAGAQINLANSEKKQISIEILEPEPASNHLLNKMFLNRQEVVKQNDDDFAPQIRIKDLAHREVGEEDIARIIHKMTRIPLTKLQETEANKFLMLEEKLNNVVIGQKNAIKAISNSLKRARVGLKNPNRPIGSFLLVGPSGIGKTKLAAEAANILFLNENAFFPIDMSEYMDKFSISRLIGAPPGYVGYEKGGELTEKVRRHPFCVILLEDIDKAHPDILNILLQILDEGTLTDSFGRRVDFRNTVIFMTMNCKSTTERSIGFCKDAIYENSIHKQIRQLFSPEFINRIDEIAELNPLNKTDLLEIIKLELKTLNQKLAENEIKITISPEIFDYVLELVKLNSYGGRTIKRLIRELIEDRIAEKIIKNEIRSGDHILLKNSDGELDFSVMNQAA